jgi:hypothetical protein
MPLYGNWCGPNHPKSGTEPIAIDDIDQACKDHDKCYGKHGYFKEDCDHILLRDLDAIVRRKGRDLSLEQRLAIIEIKIAFGLVTPDTFPNLPLEFAKIGIRSVLHNIKCLSLIPFFWLGMFKDIDAGCKSSHRTW